jgi:hypothetical protein
MSDKAKPQSSIYNQVVKITHVYLGPAAERFIDRQVENHLHKAPNKLTRADLLSLIDWIRVVVSLLTEDSEIVEEYIHELRKLTMPNPTANTSKG